jgi:DNA mismatch endonuclease (patch repair protein)
MHTCQRRRKAPVNHAEYWQAKRERNAARDKRSLRALRRQGWEVLTVWECQTRKADALKDRLTVFLSRRVKHPS